MQHITTQPNLVGLCIYCPPNPQMYNSQSFTRRLKDPWGFKPSLFHQRTLFCRFGYGALFFGGSSIWILVDPSGGPCPLLRLFTANFQTSHISLEGGRANIVVELLGFSVASSATCSRWDFYTQGIVECRDVLGSTRVICPSRDISDRGPVSAAGDRAPWLRMDMSE